MLVSSAKRWKVNLSEQFGKSLIYNRESKGPRTEPWGIHHRILA